MICPKLTDSSSVDKNTDKFLISSLISLSIYFYEDLYNLFLLLLSAKIDYEIIISLSLSVSVRIVYSSMKWQELVWKLDCNFQC